MKYIHIETSLDIFASYFANQYLVDFKNNVLNNLSYHNIITITFYKYSSMKIIQQL